MAGQNGPSNGSQGPLGPERMWIGLAIAAALIMGWKLSTPAPRDSSEPVAILEVIENGQGRIEKVTRADCLRLDGRVWVALDDGVDCISYVVAGAINGADIALVFLNGDVPEERLAEASHATARVGEQDSAGLLARRYDLPVVIVGRPGLMGSTGFHLAGGRRDEAQVMDAAVAAIKDKLGLRRLALAGQSGGARIIAQLMVMGHQGISCAAMGSGAYGIPGLKGGGRSNTNVFGDPGRRYLVPLLEIARVPAAPDRRSFVIGDPEDSRVGFSEQRVWADKLEAGGHRVLTIEAKAKDNEHHGMAQQAITAAALCAKGRSDAEITTAVKAL